MKFTALISLIVVSSLALVCSAQDYGRFFSYGGGGFHRHASTVEEGAARGMADVIRSRGAANLLNSEAAINYEDARKKYIANRMQATRTFFEMRQYNKAARAAERGPRPTQEQLIRASKSRLPDRPSASQVDPLTGGVEWPIALRSATFADERAQIEKLYQQRAQTGHFSPNQYLQIKSLTSSMLVELRENIRLYPGNLSIEARKFLESLAYEAQFQAG